MLRRCRLLAKPPTFTFALIIFATGWFVLFSAFVVTLLVPRKPTLSAARSPNRYSTLDQSQLVGMESSSSESSDTPDFLRKRVHDLPEGTFSVPEWTAHLRKLGHRVCCESVHQPRYGMPQMAFALSTEPRPLAEILNELTLFDARYRWDWMRGNVIANVVPVESKLDATLSKVIFEERRLVDCTNDLHDRCGICYGGPYSRRGAGDPGCIGQWRFSLRSSNITCRDYLNLLAVQYDGMAWNISNIGTAQFDVYPREKLEAVAERLRTEARLLQQLDEQSLGKDSDGLQQGSVE